MDTYDLSMDPEVAAQVGKQPRKAWDSFVNEENKSRVCPEALDLIDKMLRYDPASRILPREAMEHSFFANVKKGK